MVRRLVRGESLKHSAEHALAESAHAVNGSETTTQRLLNVALRYADDQVPASIAHLSLGEGWTGDEALAIAVYAAASAEDYVDAIRLAANHDGDSDSTASIAGQLVGARDGILAVPHAWVRRLDVLPEALALLTQFMTVDNARLFQTA